MELFIHFGIFKTGSSYLQSICALNRELLANNGYHFPTSSFERALIRGNISPGNSGKLKDYLAAGDVNRTMALQQTWVQSAKAANCGKILISGEALVHVFATSSGLQTLVAAAEKSGITQIRAMGFFRNPVDHALSTFKHRGKGGKIKDFRHWVSKVYELPTLLDNFSQVHQHSPIHWTLRQYQKGGDFINGAFFRDWLGIVDELRTDLPRVNESVTLSEVELMVPFSSERRILASYVSEALYNLPSHKKATDKDLQKHYRQMAGEALEENRAIFTRFNTFLPAGEALEINYPETPVAEAKAAVLSAEQLRVITQEIGRLTTFPGSLYVLRRKIRNMIPRNLVRSLKKYWR
ncbi:MAG: hypothetical protein AAFR36_04050 [Bacteroidota bacterium]